MDVIKSSLMKRHPGCLSTKEAWLTIFWGQPLTIKHNITLWCLPKPRAEQVNQARHTLSVCWTWYVIIGKCCSRNYQSFVTQFGLYQFKPMPFGHYAQDLFWRLMNHILHSTKEFATASMDNLMQHMFCRASVASAGSIHQATTCQLAC